MKFFLRIQYKGGSVDLDEAESLEEILIGNDLTEGEVELITSKAESLEAQSELKAGYAFRINFREDGATWHQLMIQP